MLAELFWPKELRELVVKYRAEGVLNEEALTKTKADLNEALLQAAILFGLFIVLSILVYQESILLAFISLIMGCFITFSALFIYCKRESKYLYLYNLGTCVKGEILKRVISYNKAWQASGYGFSYRFVPSNSSQAFEGRDLVKNLIIQGDTYHNTKPLIIYSNNNPAINALYLESRNSKYKLKEKNND